MSANSTYLDGIPSTPNTVSDSWEPAVDQIDTTKKGFNAVNLSNWDATGVQPTVEAGSEIETAGGVARVGTAEMLLADPLGVNPGIVYVVIDFSSSIQPEWYYTNTSPVWNPSLAGFYEAGSGTVTRRYTGHRMFWIGNNEFKNKTKFLDQPFGVDQFYGVNGDVQTKDGLYQAWVSSGVFLRYLQAYTGRTPNGITSAQGTLILSDAGTIYVYSGLSTSPSSSFAAPGSDCRALAFDGTNLISYDFGTKLIYIHSGISATISSSFAAPGTALSGMDFDGTNLVTTDTNSRTIYIHSGISSTILVSTSVGVSALPECPVYTGNSIIFLESNSQKWFIVDDLLNNPTGVFQGYALAQFSAATYTVDDCTLWGGSLIFTTGTTNIRSLGPIPA